MLFGGTVALYSRVLGYGFTNYDDPRYITSNPHVQAGLNAESIRWAFVGNADYWHPLTWLSHMLDCQLYGGNAGGHHLTSVLWHALNAVLAFVVLRRITGSFWGSFLAAALFAWHPLRVESVAWITERKDVMSGCCFLLTLWAYLGYAERRRDGKPSIRWYAAALAVFAAGLMCKPTLVTLPLVLLALDFWPARRWTAAKASPNLALAGGPGVSSLRSAAALVLEKAPFFALSAATALATIQMQREVGAFTLDLPFAARLANAPVAIARYLGMFIWPTALTAIYRHPGWWPATTVIAAALILIAITVAAWYQRTRYPWLIVGWVWFLAMLLPTLGLIQVGFQALADRYTYVPILGLELLLIWTVGQLWDVRGRRIAFIATAATLVPFVTLTWRQEATWRDSETLYRHALAVTKDNDVAEGFLAYTLLGDHRTDEASTHARRAVALDPRNETAVYTLAQIDAAAGRIDAAIAGYRRTIELRPNDATTHYELGLLLLKSGQLDAAAEQWREAAKLHPGLAATNAQLAERYARAGQMATADVTLIAGASLAPNSAPAQLAAAQAWARRGNEREAVAGFERAIALDGKFAPPHVELGFLFLNRAEPQAATDRFNAALKIDPNLATALVGLGRAEEQLGHSAAATAAFEHALQSAPSDASVHRAWAETLARRGEFAAAIPFYRQAVQLQPNDAATHAGLGFVLFLTRQRGDALAEWKEALRLEPNFPGLRERVEQLESR